MVYNFSKIAIDISQINTQFVKNTAMYKVQKCTFTSEWYRKGSRFLTIITQGNHTVVIIQPTEKCPVDRFVLRILQGYNYSKFRFKSYSPHFTNYSPQQVLPFNWSYTTPVLVMLLLLL